MRGFFVPAKVSALLDRDDLHAVVAQDTLRPSVARPAEENALSTLHSTRVVLLLASIWLVAGCQRASGTTECPKACACSGGIISCLGTRDWELNAEATIARIPALVPLKLGSIRYNDPSRPNTAPVDANNGLPSVHLGTVSALGVDVEGRIYVIDAATDAERVYDTTGRQLLAGAPAASPAAPYSGRVRPIMVTNRSDAWVLSSDKGRGSAPKYVHFGPSGQRIGVESIAFGCRTLCPWLPQPDGQLLWMFIDGKIVLANPSGAVTRTIAWPGRSGYIEYVRWTTAVAPDGSLAVAAVRDHPGIARGLDAWDWYAVVYSPKGEKISEWLLPFKLNQAPRIAFDGRHLAFIVPLDNASGEETIVVVDMQGHPQFRTDVHPDGSNDRVLLLARATGEELWVYGNGVITRYAMQR